MRTNPIVVSIDWEISQKTQPILMTGGSGSMEEGEV
jgi:hypothetical protein